MSILVSPDELHALIEAGAAPIILDVRWRLDRPDGRDDFRAGHIPGAAYVDLESELAGHGEPTDGRHPLPAIDELEQAARRWGIDDGDSVVVYDDLAGMSAARAWWVLRWAGIEDVRILDGALSAWRASFPLETAEVSPRTGSVRLSAGHMPTIDLDGAAAQPGRGILLDARAPERFAGDIEPIDPRAGHIPGAVNVPTAQNVAPDGRFLSADELRQRFAGHGVTTGDDVAVYCGSGVTAAHQIAALSIAGIPAALFPGSWSQWSNHPERPVATGA